MKNKLLLLSTITTLSLSATAPTSSRFELYITKPTPEQLAVFLCKFCKRNLEADKEVDLKQHLAKRHNRCGTCEREFPSLKDVRAHEAEHFTSKDIKPQQNKK